MAQISVQAAAGSSCIRWSPIPTHPTSDWELSVMSGGRLSIGQFAITLTFTSREVVTLHGDKPQPGVVAFYRHVFHSSLNRKSVRHDNFSRRVLTLRR